MPDWQTSPHLHLRTVLLPVRRHASRGLDTKGIHLMTTFEQKQIENKNLGDFYKINML